MVDITAKSNTLRKATATGIVKVSKQQTIDAILNRAVPKGDVFEMAKAAGLLGVKKTPDLLPDCHPLPIEFTAVRYRVEGLEINIEVEVHTIYKTGVEVEAMHGVSVVALTMYDMLKPIDKGVEISSIRLLEKKGGKSDFKDKFRNRQDLKAAVIVCSDTISAGQKEDKAGKAIIAKLKESQVEIGAYEIIPDETDQIQACVNKFYNGSPELVIRDPRDVNMPDVRCDGTTGALTQMPIDSLRMVYTGTTTTCPVGRKIKGIVISDNVNSNTDPKNMVIQDGTAGIVVRFTSAHTFAVGAEVEVRVSGQELSEYNGLLEVNYVDPGNAIQTGTGTITPRVATISQINANLQTWESTLITVQAATASGSTTYSGSNTLTDASGSLTLYTRSQASFASTALPSGPKTFTGVLSEYSFATIPAQLSIRSTADVQ